jgi:DNA-binding LacI/PurR family transcriptional regulator
LSKLPRIDSQPNYRNVADRLKREIGETLTAGQRLESHQALSERFGVSRVTIRQALTLLQQAGYVQMLPKRGTYVAERAASPHRIRHGLVALLVENFQDPFFNEMTQHIERELLHNRVHMVLCDIAGEGLGVNYIEHLRDRVDGFIIGASLQESSWMQYRILSTVGVPYVFFDRDIRSVPGDRVLVDNYLGGRMAAEHLLSLGRHRVFATLTYAWPKKALQAPHEVMVLRVRGFREKLLESGVDEADILLLTGQGGRTKEAGADAAEHWLSHKPRATALFATNDILALGVIEVAERHGLRMPEDYALLGFDDINLVRWLNIPLTTIAQPKEEIAHQAVRLLLEQIDGSRREPTHHVLLKPRLVERGSTTGSAREIR